MLKVSDIQTSLKGFKEWKMYKGRLKSCFEGNTYFKIRTKITELQGMLIKFNKIFMAYCSIFIILII